MWTWYGRTAPGSIVTIPVLNPLAVQAPLTISRKETPGPKEVASPIPGRIASTRSAAFAFSMVITQSPFGQRYYAVEGASHTLVRLQWSNLDDCSASLNSLVRDSVVLALVAQIRQPGVGVEIGHSRSELDAVVQCQVCAEDGVDHQVYKAAA